MKNIKIKSKLYDYEVVFCKDFKDELENYREVPVTYVVDANVYELYRDKFIEICPDKIYLVNAVENEKNMETIMDMIAFWKSIGVQKNWKVICFGGGITQDVTTVAANLYLRNIDWYFFPTTLLAMCDSCIGGKCGINFGEYKNQIGVFYPPKKIFIDTAFLNTLSEEDYLNGWGELLKFSLTSDVAFYEELKKEECYIPCKRIDDYIYKGLYVKKEVIEEDEFESDLRRILNYGHTFGHALEACSNYEIPHGKAVIWGIDVVNYIAWKENLITEEVYWDVKSVIKNSFIKKEIIVENPKQLYEATKKDKKVRNNIVSLAVLDKLSHLIVYPVEMNEKLESLFWNYIEETHEYYCN